MTSISLSPSGESLSRLRFGPLPFAFSFPFVLAAIVDGGISESEAESSIVIGSDVRALSLPLDGSAEIVEGIVDIREDELGEGGRGREGGGRAYNSVQCLAVLSCWTRLRTYSVAIDGTKR
jgi:hypothetical protein